MRARVRGGRAVYGDLWLVQAEASTRGGAHPARENMNRFLLRWGHLLDDDSETIAQLFDARFNSAWGMSAEGGSASTPGRPGRAPAMSRSHVTPPTRMSATPWWPPPSARPRCTAPRGRLRPCSAISDPGEPSALVRTLELAFERSDRRDERARAVAERCAPEAIAARVGELLSSAAKGVSVQGSTL